MIQIVIKITTKNIIMIITKKVKRNQAEIKQNVKIKIIRRKIRKKQVQGSITKEHEKT